MEYDLEVNSDPKDNPPLDEDDLQDLANTLNTMAAAENAKENRISGQAAAGIVRVLKVEDADLTTTSTTTTTTTPPTTVKPPGITQPFEYRSVYL